MIIIDRIEGEFAVCECDGVMKDIPLSQIGCDVNEGDVLVFSEEMYVVDANATSQRKKRAEALFERFKKKTGL